MNIFGETPYDGHPVYIYKVSRKVWTTARQQVGHSKLNKKVLYHFAKFAIVNEILNIQSRQIGAREGKRSSDRTAQCVKRWPPARGERSERAAAHSDRAVTALFSRLNALRLNIIK